MNIKPLADYVVVKAVIDEVTKSGIILPDTVSKERPQQGEIVAAGEGKILENGQRSPMSVKVGDKVMFRGYPQEVKIEGQDYLIIKESDVVAIIA
jgi:chaperonin GroES